MTNSKQTKTSASAKSTTAHDVVNSQVARFITSPENMKKIKKLGGGPIEITTGKRNIGKIAITIPILDKHGEQAISDSGAWRFFVATNLEFQKSGKWKLTTFRAESDLVAPVEVGKTMTDDQALLLVKQIFDSVEK